MRAPTLTRTPEEVAWLQGVGVLNLQRHISMHTGLYDTAVLCHPNTFKNKAFAREKKPVDA